jgi:hypothetical protein
VPEVGCGCKYNSCYRIALWALSGHVPSVIFPYTSVAVPVVCNRQLSYASHSGNSSSLADGLTPTLNNEPKLTQEASLKQLLQSLMHTERTQSALNMYKNRLLDAIKLIVRTCVMEYLSFFDPSMAYEDNPFDPYGGDSNVSGACVCSRLSTAFVSC